MTKLPSFALAAVLSAGIGAPISASPASRISLALADPSRASDRLADKRRHPDELVALADLKPGQRVLDLIPGTGYWTRIFSRVVGPRGKVYAVWPKPYAHDAMGNVQQLQAIARTRSNVVVQIQPTVDLTAPEPVDAVWTSDNYHDYNDKFMGDPGSQSLARAAYRILKPGGIFVVIDHAAARGHGLEDTETFHRIERAVVIRQAAAAGFRLVGESHVLQNSTDPMTVPVFDPKIRGRTNQFALKFRKPRR